jgi:hypothetical protein
MSSPLLINFPGILAIYLIYGGIIYAAYQDTLLSDGQYALVMMAVSLFCTLAWYVIGEWGIKPWAHTRIKLAIWCVLLAIIVIIAGVTIMMWSTFWPLSFFARDVDLMILFAGGIGSYYLSSVLFSPPGVKHLIWPAVIIRKW